MKILIDMNLSPAWVEFLNGAGFEATHWTKLGAARIPDAPILGYAAKRDFVVLTQDLDVSAILASPKTERPGVVLVAAADTAPGAIGVQVMAALRQAAADLGNGALVAVDPARKSLRLLQFA
jgi:predicted nuclease of predicted toxin-antitoxin system